MQRLMLTALILSLGGVALAEPGYGEDKKETKDALPRESSVKWDVQVLEDGPTLSVVKREVKGNKVTWVLENKRNLGTEITFGYQAALYDEDGVKLETIGIETEPFLLNMMKGERNRFTLNLPPEDKLKGGRKAVIKSGPF